MINSLIYVASQHDFYLAMGWTIASGVFIGATLYNGDLSRLMKGLVTLIPYCGMIILTTVERLSVKNLNPISHPQSLASLATLLYVTIAYVLGLIIGVIVVRLTKRKVSHAQSYPLMSAKS